MSGAEAGTVARELLLLLLARNPVAGDIRERLGSDIDWNEFHRLVLHHQVLPLVYQGLQSCRKLLPGDTFERLRSMHAANALRNLILMRELDRLLALLRETGIAVISLRGPSLAAEVYGDVALRVFSDLDLYLDEDAVLSAVRCLEAAGYRLEADFPPRRWPSLARIGNQLSLMHSERGWLVELHWRPFHPLYALDGLPAVNLASGSLAAEEMLLILAVHGAKHLWGRLKWLVDIDRLIRVEPALDWRKVFKMAERAGCLRMLCLGLLLAGRLGELDLPSSIREKVDADLTARKLADLVWRRCFDVDCTGRRFGEEYRYHLAVRERWRDRLRLAWRWPLWPRSDDWRAFPGGDRLFALYLLGRPLRMIWKWLVRPRLAGRRVSA